MEPTNNEQLLRSEVEKLQAENADLRRRIKRLNDEINTGTRYKHMNTVILIVSYLLSAVMYQVAVMQWNLDQLAYVVGFMMFGIMVVTQIAIRFIWVLVLAIRDQW